MTTVVIALVTRTHQDTTRGPQDTTIAKKTAASVGAAGVEKRTTLCGGGGIEVEVEVLVTGKTKSMQYPYSTSLPFLLSTHLKA